MTVHNNEANLVLAAEDFEINQFRALHKFSSNDERVISKLMAHGPVLLQGSRGSGKSALMREAAERLLISTNAGALAIYLSLRHMPLLRSVGDEYQRILCGLLVNKVKHVLKDTEFTFDASPNLIEVQAALTDLSQRIKKRIVLMFDDAAHIGREASLTEFFDIFRTLGSSSVSCKATIYPGVTNFGNRFDVYNDATVVDVIRDEHQPGFSKLFMDVVSARFPEIVEKGFSSELSLEKFSHFLGKSVLGNMRSFIFVCNNLTNSAESRIGLPTLTKSYLDMASNFYWPLIDEVKPKLGKYVSVVEPSKEITEKIFSEAGKHQNPNVIIHKDTLGRLSKAFEILEYVGFVSKREVSKALKSGGRGSRYSLNLCMLLENVSGTRITASLFEKWNQQDEEAIQIHTKSEVFNEINLPDFNDGSDPEILSNSLDVLRKSPIYPYGISDRLIERLRSANIVTVRDLYDATDQQLDDIEYIGEYRVKQLKGIVAQAIWL
mgnify:CR=1 FL=1